MTTRKNRSAQASRQLALNAWREFRSKAPGIINANAYFFTTHYSAKERRAAERRACSAVYNWLVSYFPRDMVEVEQNESVYLDGDLVFYYRETCNYVYKRQNLRAIKEKFLSMYET